MWDDGEGWWTRTVRFGEAVYAARCPKCARFVKVDEVTVTRSTWDGQEADLPQPNATCAKHGRVTTPFLCWKGDCQ